MQPCVKSLFWFHVLYLLHSIFRLLKKVTIVFLHWNSHFIEVNCKSWLTWILSSLKTESSKHYGCNDTKNFITIYCPWCNIYNKDNRRDIPDHDRHPSVIIDVLSCSCIQNMAATAPKFSNRASILKVQVKKLIPKVLLLSWKGKKIWLVMSLFFRTTKFNTLCKLHYLWHYFRLNSPVTEYRKRVPIVCVKCNKNV